MSAKAMPTVTPARPIAHAGRRESITEHDRTCRLRTPLKTAKDWRRGKVDLLLQQLRGNQAQRRTWPSRVPHRHASVQADAQVCPDPSLAHRLVPLPEAVAL